MSPQLALTTHSVAMGPGLRRDDTFFVATPKRCNVDYSRSTIVTLAMPPPSHMVCKP
ncbi:hypothetical protein ACVIW2_006696 [Bradyrhizobium huanghuaihaiense]|uniref:Uncharacterized protein n=1 Tax=Bradyrhizobium huanghuaihaiense TaxID=990078 RepID=A0A562RDR4_9BRAD|nr:hypothetical protein IQ16_04861 [Bradyrhizobium huanghuaihaiense]